MKDLGFDANIFLNIYFINIKNKIVILLKIT